MGENLVQAFITEEFKTSVTEVLSGALVGKETANFEFPLFTKYGERKHILLNATTRKGPDGDIIGVIGVGQDITQIREITSEHERVADDLSRLIESANAPIFGVDLQGMVTEWNKKAADLLGYTKSEVLGKNLVQHFIQQENKSSVLDVLTNALAGEEAANYELPLLSKHGEHYTVLLNATTRRDGKGQITGVVGVGQDITELNQVMAQSKSVADDLTQLIETANAPIFGIDTEGKISEWNRRTAEITGFTKQEAIGKDLVSNFIHLDYKESVSNVLTMALSGTETDNYELPLYTKGGMRRDILLNATTRKSSSGRVIGVVGVGQDITGLKQASERAQRIADDLTRLIETANAPIFGIDTNGKVTEWNTKAEEISGYSKSETIGKHLVNSFIHLEFRASIDEVFRQALMGIEVANFELPLFSREGKRREVLLNATPRRGEDGSVVGVLGVGQDITALKQQQQEAIRIADDLGRIIETANAPIFGVDVTGHVTEWNLMLAKLSQVSKEDALGKSLVQNFITEQYQENVGHVLLQALRGDQTSSFELPLVSHGENHKAILLLNATTRRGPRGEVIGAICVGQDITQISAMKEEQQRTADDLAQLIDTANAPIFGVDLNGMVNEWNRKAADLLGYTKSETMGKNFVDNFIQMENKIDVREVLRKALQGEETNNYSTPLLSKYNKRYTVLLNATTRRSANGQISGVVGVGQDITELNEALAQSKRAAEDLMRFVETANAPIFGIDTMGLVNEWNAKASSLLCFTKEEAMGKSLVQNFITKEFKASVSDVLAAALNGVDTANFEFPLFTKLGERREFLLNATTRRGPNGEITGVIGVGQDITRIREITKEQERVADDLSRLIESANAPIFGVDLKGMVTEWNRKAADLLGYTRDETMGKHLVNNFIQPENRQSVEGVLQRALSGEETANYELPLLSKTQKRLTVLLNATTRRDAKGHIVGVVGVGQDITALNNLMAESQRVADDLTRLIETAHAPIFGINIDGEVTEWNHMMHNLTAYPKEEAQGKNLVTTFITEGYREAVGNVLELALRGVETANFEFPLFAKRKEWRQERKIQILMSATPRRGPDGKVIGMIGVGQDVTQLKRETEKAETTAKDLSRIIDTANAPIFGVDKNLRVTEWNQMMSKISGISPGEAIGQGLLDWLTEKTTQENIETVLRAALVGSETENFELRFNRRSKTGHESGQVVLLLSATARLDSFGQITGVVSIGQDITEHKALEEKKMRFMAVVSHELRSPIHGICGLSEAMVSSETDPSRRKQMSMINNCSMRLLDLVTNIMSVSSMRNKTVKLNKGPCNITQIIEETVHLLLHATDKRGKAVMKPDVKMINQVEEANLPIIDADAYRITQVFNNLVMNALKFTARGTIRLYAEEDKRANRVKVSVEDTGIGIGSAHLERIFEPFEQEDDSEARTFEGIGLGLAISREVVRRHGGEIVVTSQVGKGSTFTVVLPMQSFDDKEATEGSEPGEGNMDDNGVDPQDPHMASQYLQAADTAEETHDSVVNSSDCTVMIVDELQVNQEYVKVALRPLGWKVIIAMSGAEALRMLQEKPELPCDIMILDTTMAKMSGCQLLRKIREDRKIGLWDLPILALCAKTPSNEAAVEAFTSGATDFMARPFDQDELRARLRICVKIRNFARKKLGELALKDLAEDPRVLEIIESGGGRSMLPVHIQSKFDKDKILAEQHPRVAFLCCRINSFNIQAENMTSQQATQFLNTLAEVSDQLAEGQDVLKLISEVDSFVAVTGFADNSAAVVERITKYALLLLAASRRIKVPVPNMELELLIGIYIGPAMGGVVSKKWPRYHFFGETLNRARLLQDSGVPGCIHASEEIVAELKASGVKLPQNATIASRGRMKVGKDVVQCSLICPQSHSSVAKNPPPLPESFQLRPPAEAYSVLEAATMCRKLPSMSNPPQLENADIHIVSTDDDEVNQVVIQNIFEPEGYKLSIAMDGIQCLELFAKAEANKVPFPSVLLLDSMMPGMSGIEVCRKLRERYQLMDLAIIMLTCRSSPEEIAEALSAGCNDYVTKPFNRVELLARVRVQLECRQACHALLGKKNADETHSGAAPPHTSALPAPEASALKSSRVVQKIELRDLEASWGGQSGNDVHVEILTRRMDDLRKEVLELRKKLRTRDKDAITMKSQLAASQAEAQSAWQKLLAAEEDAMIREEECESLSDKLTMYTA
eukprot:TRINITY_DN933_c0_g1_i1.p1 TRINITY_DN933_c0_g1~~TRINITY_DN933_c0_g1_i1.p1  ORF type:complete len:2241 (-),score=455.68 TRINITY_DN933_c0_g1_i1:336-6929(-)